MRTTEKRLNRGAILEERCWERVDSVMTDTNGFNDADDGRPACKKRNKKERKIIIASQCVVSREDFWPNGTFFQFGIAQDRHAEEGIKGEREGKGREREREKAWKREEKKKKLQGLKILEYYLHFPLCSPYEDWAKPGQKPDCGPNRHGLESSESCVSKDDGFRCSQASKLLPRGKDPQTACLSIAVFHDTCPKSRGLYSRVSFFYNLLSFLFFLFENRGSGKRMATKGWLKQGLEKCSEMQPVLLLCSCRLEMRSIEWYRIVFVMCRM